MNAFPASPSECERKIRGRQNRISLYLHVTQPQREPIVTVLRLLVREARPLADVPPASPGEEEREHNRGATVSFHLLHATGERLPNTNQKKISLTLASGYVSLRWPRYVTRHDLPGRCESKSFCAILRPRGGRRGGRHRPAEFTESVNKTTKEFEISVFIINKITNRLK